MMRKAMVGAQVLFMAGGLALAGKSELWLHIHVDAGGRHGEGVRVNLPLSLVEELLPLIQIDELHGGRVPMDCLGLDDQLQGMDLRALWEAVQGADDAEFLRIRTGDQDVRIVKEDGWLLLGTEEGSRGRVRIRFPLAVVDALFSGEPGELDILAAVEALGRHGQGGDLVRVDDGGRRVRIWIDDRDAED